MDRHRIGVALTKCFFCGGDSDILINTILVADAAKRVEAAHGKVASMHPCSECEKHMKQGVILITIDSEKSDPAWNSPPTTPEYRKHWMPNPYRTGGFFVVKEEAIRRIMSEEMSAWALKHRWMFIEHEAATAIGLFASAKTK